MEQQVECLIGGDLLPWERRYFHAFLRLLENQMRLRIRDSSSQEALPSDAALWVVARDWRAALQELPTHHAGRVFVSVLGTRAQPRWFGFFDRHWNPTPRLDVHLIAHSPYAFRFLKEMEKIPVGNLLQLSLPGLLNETAESPSQSIRVGYLSSLTSDANVALLVSVAHYVSRKGLPIRFHVPDHGKLVSHLKAMVCDLELEDYFLALPDPDLGMDILLHTPLKTEHFIPVLWKGSQGIPVLTSDVPGIEELVSDGHDGFIVAVNEVKPLGELLARLAENESLRSSLGDRLRQGLAKRFPLDKIIGQYRSVFTTREPALRSAAA